MGDGGSKLGSVVGMAFGALFALAGVAIVVVVLFFVGKELDVLDELATFQVSALEGLSVDDAILLEGQLDDSNEASFQGFVVGCEQTERRGREGHTSWDITSESNQPVTVTADGVAFVVNLDRPCPRGEFGTVDMGESTRFIGYPPGAQLTVVGTFVAVDPPTVRGDLHFGGTVEAYRSMLGTAKGAILPLGAVFFIAGAFVFWRAKRSRRRG